MTANEKIRALIWGGLADDREEAIEQLVDMGELDEDDIPDEDDGQGPGFVPSGPEDNAGVYSDADPGW